MARRGRRRKAGQREPNGRQSRAREFREDPNNYWGSRHRLDGVKPEVKAAMDAVLTRGVLCIDCPTCDAIDGAACVGLHGQPVPPHDGRYDLARRSADFLTLEQRDIMVGGHAEARERNLGYATGIAYERGLFRGQGSADGRELLDAADIYAALHHRVWRDLNADIQSALDSKYGPEAFSLLLQVGRVARPRPPNSNFAKLVAEQPPPAEYRTPEEVARYRLSVASKYGAAWQALLDAGLTERLIVERVVIEGFSPSWIRSTPLVHRLLDEQKAFVDGLHAIASELDLFVARQNRDRRREDPGEGRAAD